MNDAEVEALQDDLTEMTEERDGLLERISQLETELASADERIRELTAVLDGIHTDAGKAIA